MVEPYLQGLLNEIYLKYHGVTYDEFESPKWLPDKGTMYNRPEHLHTKRVTEQLLQAEKEFQARFGISKLQFYTLRNIFRDNEILQGGPAHSLELIMMIGLQSLKKMGSHQDLQETFELRTKGNHPATNQLPDILKKFRTALLELFPYLFQRKLHQFGSPSSRFKEVQAKNLQHLQQIWPTLQGSIDGTVIDINGYGIPQSSKVSYMSYKTKGIALNTLAVVDHNGFCSYMGDSHKGSSHDYLLYKFSLVNEGLEEFLNTCDSIVDSNGVSEHGVLLGDAGFVGDQFVIVPYPDTRYHLESFGYGSRKVAEMTDEARELRQKIRDRHEIYNLSHSSVRSCVENLFGVTKNRWRKIKATVDYNPDTAEDIIQCCFLLDNLAKLNTHQLRLLELQVLNLTLLEPIGSSRTYPLGRNPTEKDINTAFDTKVTPEQKQEFMRKRLKASLLLEMHYLQDNPNELKDWIFEDIRLKDGAYLNNKTAEQKEELFKRLLQDIGYERGEMIQRQNDIHMQNVNSCRYL